MNSQIEIYCRNIRRYISMDGGEKLLDLYHRTPELNALEIPICALVNNKVESLNYPVFSPKTVEFCSLSTPEGQRAYVRSLCMMLYHAVHTIMPGASLHIEHSLAAGYYCRIIGVPTVTAEDVEKLRAHMNELVERDLPFVRRERLTSDVVEIFRSQGLIDKVKLLSSLHELYTVYYTLDGLSDSYYGPLVSSTGLLKVFNLTPYKDGLLLHGPARDDLSKPAEMENQPKMYKAFTDYVAFNSVVGVSTVGELNEVVERGESRMLINVSEALHNNRIAAIADDITRRFHDGGARVVFIAGPSSSGKTTFTKRLGIQLVTNLLKPQLISLDDYFVNRVDTPKDESGEYDYESLYALDLDTFNDHINRLIRGERVELPYYNFSTGSREYRGNFVQLPADGLLLIEGIHGLNPELTAHVPEQMKYRIYVSALTTISIDDHNWIPTTDNRLLRRIVRDAKYRGVAPEETIRRWPSVRRGEERWIFPYQENADVMFNSSLLFELGVLKDRAEQLLRSVPRDVAEYSESSRLRRFISYFRAISETDVPSTSLLREFLGGSSFKY